AKGAPQASTTCSETCGSGLRNALVATQGHKPTHASFAEASTTSIPTASRAPTARDMVNAITCRSASDFAAARRDSRRAFAASGLLGLAASGEIGRRSLLPRLRDAPRGDSIRERTGELFGFAIERISNLLGPQSGRRLLEHRFDRINHARDVVGRPASE